MLGGMCAYADLSHGRCDLSCDYCYACEMADQCSLQVFGTVAMSRQPDKYF